MICASKDRMSNEQIKMHVYFQGLDWDGIHDVQAPWIPPLKSLTDTVRYSSHFLVVLVSFFLSLSLFFF